MLHVQLYSLFWLHHQKIPIFIDIPHAHNYSPNISENLNSNRSIAYTYTTRVLDALYQYYSLYSVLLYNIVKYVR